MQNEIIHAGDLLDDNGSLLQIGWAKDLLLNYNRNKIKASKFQIKEWDYYCVLNQNFGVAITMADNGYMGFAAVTVFDFKIPSQWTKTIMTPFPLGKTNLPSTSSEGNIIFSHKDAQLEFIKDGDLRHIKISIDNFYKSQKLQGEITLFQPNDMETMTIVTPFHKKRKFYYNQKINCMMASGKLKIGSKILNFDTEPSYGVLDWGRGVWTYSNEWYWGSGSGKVNGELFGFNIGYGFGDTSKASENMLFYKGKAHKLDQVTFHIPKDSFMKPWTFTSNDNRFEMQFEPVIDRHSNMNLLVLKSNQHQVFGYFSGKAILDNSQEIILDKFFGFAEKVMNRW